MRVKVIRIFFLIFFLFLYTALTLKPTQAFSTNDRGMVVPPESSNTSKNAWGNYHALIVGINAYKEWRPLKTAVHDAKMLKEILVKRYKFNVENVLLRIEKEATRSKLIMDLRNLAQILNEKDNLLIYFAGHGQLDDLTGDGYWIPVEGKLKDPSTWITHSTVKSILSSEKMRAKNVVVVADSCYSGALLRGGPSLLSLNDQEYRNKLIELAGKRSRQVITSGGVEPVADGGRDGHSLFAYYFLKALKENKRAAIDLENLFHTQVWKYVTEIGGQRPNVGRLKTPMDEGGQFVLTQSIMESTEPAQTPSRRLGHLEIRANVSDAQVFVDDKNVGEVPAFVPDLKIGAHQVRITKNGYKIWKRQINVEPGRKKVVRAVLEILAPRKARLFVKTDPSDARVRILNISPRFYRGMELEDGRFHVEVSAEGYETQTLWVSLEAGEDKDVSIALKPKETGWFVNSLDMAFIRIPAGSFMMGSQLSAAEVAKRYGGKEEWYKDEHPWHRVTLSRAFYLQTTEVTVGQWRAFVKDTGYKSEAETGGGSYVWTVKWEKKQGIYWDNPGFSQTDDHPVMGVSYNDVQKFIKWLNQKEGKAYRLPTEAEWEYAARAGTTTIRFWGDDPDDACRYANVADQKAKRKYNWTGVHNCDDGYIHTAPVGRFQSNPFGLHDMLGNVWEWVQDWYGDYPSSAVNDPSRPSKGAFRVIRGCSWFNGPGYVRSAGRLGLTPGDRSIYLGFRLARIP